jgi:transcriptional regulator with XRE-family HTH domain
MNQERSIFAINLIRYRKQKGFSQGDLAETAGISRRMIGHYEAHTTIPPLDKIDALAKALGINPSQLLENPKAETNTEIDLSSIDPRSIKKLKDILSLPPEDRNDLYRILNKMVRKNQLEKEQKPTSKKRQTQKQ